MPRAVAGVDFHRRTRLAALIDVVTVWGSVKPSSTELSESGEKKTIAVNDEATHPNEARPLLWPETWKNRLRGVFFVVSHILQVVFALKLFKSSNVRRTNGPLIIRKTPASPLLRKCSQRWRHWSPRLLARIYHEKVATFACSQVSIHHRQ